MNFEEFKIDYNLAFVKTIEYRPGELGYLIGRLRIATLRRMYPIWASAIDDDVDEHNRRLKLYTGA